jgi:pyridoxine/pyridoxamine 5'-phosphate oxidase
MEAAGRTRKRIDSMEIDSSDPDMMSEKEPVSKVAIPSSPTKEMRPLTLPITVKKNGNPIKKIVIKNLKSKGLTFYRLMMDFMKLTVKLVKPRVPITFEEDTWKKLKNAVEAIQQSRPVADGLEDLYKACENLCSYKMGYSLYMKLQQVCETHIKQESYRLLE